MPLSPHDRSDATADVRRVATGDQELGPDAVRALARAYLVLRTALEDAPSPIDVDGRVDHRSPYAGWYREVRATRLAATTAEHVLAPAAAPDLALAEARRDEAAERDRQAARALVAAFAEPRAGAPARAPAGPRRTHV